MAGFLGAMLGGLIITFFVALLFKKLIFSAMDEPNRFLASNVSSLLVATIIGGFGLAPPHQTAFALAFVTYVIPVGFWTIYDWVKWSRASA